MEFPGRRLLLSFAAGLGVLAVILGYRMTRETSPLDALTEVRRVLPAGEQVEVEVLNGTARNGLARLGTRVLRRAGFDVVAYGTAAERVDTTTVLIRRGGQRPARLLLEALGTGRVIEAPDTLRLVDLTVLLGADWYPPAGLIP